MRPALMVKNPSWEEKKITKHNSLQEQAKLMEN